MIINQILSRKERIFFSTLNQLQKSSLIILFYQISRSFSQTPGQIDYFSSRIILYSFLIDSRLSERAGEIGWKYRRIWKKLPTEGILSFLKNSDLFPSANSVSVSISNNCTFARPSASINESVPLPRAIRYEVAVPAGRRKRKPGTVKFF